MSKVAAIQMTSVADVNRNLEAAGQMLRGARAQGAVLAALPENFAFMGHQESDKLAIAERPGEGPIQDFLSKAARQHGLWIVGGTIPMRIDGDADRVAAACLLYDDQGQMVARYDKIHLFDVDIPGKSERYRESASVRPGTTPVCVSTPVGRLGLAVCYDLRFPSCSAAC